jgi:hypothetical protein
LRLRKVFRRIHFPSETSPGFFWNLISRHSVDLLKGSTNILFLGFKFQFYQWAVSDEVVSFVFDAKDAKRANGAKKDFGKTAE